jgi:hypothetical protein
MRKSLVGLFAGLAMLFAFLPLAVFAFFMDGGASAPPDAASRSVTVTVTSQAGDDFAAALPAQPCIEVPAVQG